MADALFARGLMSLVNGLVPCIVRFISPDALDVALALRVHAMYH